MDAISYIWHQGYQRGLPPLPTAGQISALLAPQQAAPMQTSCTYNAAGHMQCTSSTMLEFLAPARCAAHRCPSDSLGVCIMQMAYALIKNAISAAAPGPRVLTLAGSGSKLVLYGTVRLAVHTPARLRPLLQKGTVISRQQMNEGVRRDISVLKSCGVTRATAAEVQPCKVHGQLTRH